MSFVRIDPPGTLCIHEAIRDVVRRQRPASFIDVGCGDGNVSKVLCSLGMTGTGIDFSHPAIERCRHLLNNEIESGRFKPIQGDATTLSLPPSDLAVSVMVMEHIEDDLNFARHLRSLVKDGGGVAVCVPGRKDHWSLEDETVGNVRRYERAELHHTLTAAGLVDVEVWSVGVPTVNILFWAGQWLLKRSGEKHKTVLDQRQQTELSGLQEIPWKTHFPPWVRLILNRAVLYPLLWVQRFFYRTNLGITLIGFGRAAPPARRCKGSNGFPGGLV